MRSRKWATIAAIVIAVLFTAVSQAQAQAATFQEVRDAVAGKFFDAAKTKTEAGHPNHLIIGFDTGFDPVTLISNAFTVSPLAFNNRRAMDTLTMRVIAPSGFYIAKVTYSQRGSGSTGRTDVEAGIAQWTVASHPFVLGNFTSNPDLTKTVDLSASRLRDIRVVLSVSLFSQTGSLSLTGADVFVTLLPL